MDEWEGIWRALGDYIYEAASEVTRGEMRELSPWQLGALLFGFGLGETERASEMLGIDPVCSFEDYAVRSVESAGYGAEVMGYIEVARGVGVDRLAELLHGSAKAARDKFAGRVTNTIGWKKVFGR